MTHLPVAARNPEQTASKVLAVKCFGVSLAAGLLAAIVAVVATWPDMTAYATRNRIGGYAELLPPTYPTTTYTYPKTTTTTTTTLTTLTAEELWELYLETMYMYSLTSPTTTIGPWTTTTTTKLP